MKAAIITVAGVASRFNENLDKEALKCIYYEKDPKETILYQQLRRMRQCDKIMVVGGYLFQELQHYVETECTNYRDKVTLVYNPYYIKYGSGYSLYMGLKEVENENTEEIIFAEGDLYFDKNSFECIMNRKSDIVTITGEPIYSNKAVVVYINARNKVQYLYNALHECLEIKEPFKAVFNSGQVWKFIETERLFGILEEMSAVKLQGTNLEIIQEYYGVIETDQIEIVKFKDWINCNTPKDYYEMLKFF